MAAKLKSISRQIHWSLLGKATLFAVAWFVLPFWLFALVALYLYFFPLFNTWKLFWPFFALLILTYIEEPGTGVPGWIFLVVFAALFYYLLLIKDLLLIDRKSAYELLILVLSFFLLGDFYGQFGTHGITGASLWFGFLTAALIGLLLNGLMRSFSDTIHENPMRRVTIWLAFVLLLQFLILGLFLSLNFTYQSVVVFLVSVLVIDLLPENCLEVGGVSRRRVMTTGVTIFALLFIVLASVRWGL
jgi:hypothetical protein